MDGTNDGTIEISTANHVLIHLLGVDIRHNIPNTTKTYDPPIPPGKTHPEFDIALSLTLTDIKIQGRPPHDPIKILGDFDLGRRRRVLDPMNDETFFRLTQNIIVITEKEDLGIRLYLAIQANINAAFPTKEQTIEIALVRNSGGWRPDTPGGRTDFRLDSEYYDNPYIEGSLVYGA